MGLNRFRGEQQQLILMPLDEKYNILFCLCYAKLEYLLIT